MLKHKKKILAIAIILVFAFIVRLAYVSVYNDPVSSDSAQYDALAYNMLQGKGYILNPSLDNSEVSQYALGASPSGWRPPGYPIFLLAVYKVFGHNYDAVYILQAIIGVLTALMIYLIGNKLWSHKIGVFGAAFFAIWPPFVVLTAQILTETLLNFLVITSLYISLLIIKQKKTKLLLWIAFGFLTGFAALVRPTYLLFPIFMIILIMILRKRNILASIKNKENYVPSIALALIIVVLLTGVWTLRNSEELGGPVVGSTQQGLGVYFGTFPFNVSTNANANSNNPYYKSVFAGPGTEVDKSRNLTQKGLERMIQNPIKTFFIKIDNVYRVWNMPYMARVLNNYTYDIFIQNNVFFKTYLPRGSLQFFILLYTYIIIHAAIIILFILSLIFTKWWKKKELILLYFPILYLCVMIFLTIGIDRYVLSVIPIIFMGSFNYLITHLSSRSNNSKVFGKKYSYKKEILRLCRNKKFIFIFSSFKDEIDTKQVIKKLLSEGKSVILPISHNNHTITCHQISKYTDLVKGKFGILEPRKNSKIVEKEKIDIFFIPGTRFDINGNRKGRGKGYFDRFLQNVDKPIIGLCKDQYVKKSITKNSWDVSVEYIITDKRFIKCNNI